MPDRRYTVAEIDRMRETIRRKYPSPASKYPTTAGPVRSVHAATDFSANIEQELRTYMQNGTEPEELEAVLARDVGSFRD